MADLSQQLVVQTGLNPSYAAANAGGDTAPTRDNGFIHVKNASGVSVTVTVDSVTACDQGFDHDLSVAIPAGEERMIGPLTPGRFGATAAITYSAVSSVTIAALGV